MKSSQFRILFVLVISVIIAQAQNSTTCPDGYDCLSQQICTGIPIKCSPGTWCPGGYNVADMCPKKHFCETPAEKKMCPDGTYCRTAVLKAGECSDLSPCPEGSWRQHQFDYLLILIATFVALFGSFAVYEHIKEKYFSSDALDSVELPAVNEKGKVEAFGPSTTMESALESNSRLNLRFEDLGVVIPTKKGDKMILAGVSGEFKSGQVSAIMGPSGAGKTTLMSVLSGKLKNTGKVFVNGREDSVSSFQKLVGYVPQEDVMLRTLRVREVLEHSARIRLPSDWTDSQRIAIVNDVMRLLKIDHVADSVIGDAETRGVSGGERKRVNIGLELVALPKLLFLDEPTTGLDSNTSKEIMAFLRLIAQQGITVVIVIHQPRYEILQMCDELLLLAKGGKTVFMGPTNDALDYFAHAGFPCPTHFNPADWYMDVISGKVSPKSVKVEDISTTPTTKATEVTLAVESKTLLFDPNVLVELWASKAPQNTSQAVGGLVLNRTTPGFFAQFGWFLYRSLLQLLRNKRGLVLEITYQVITGVAMAMAGISHEMYIPPLPENMIQLCPEVIRDRCQNESILPSVPITMFFMTMTAGVSSVTAANRTFTEEKDVYYREAGSGINTAAYFLAKCVFDLYSIARNAFVLLTFYVVICDPPGSFAGWFGGMFFLMFAAHGMGYFFSNILPPAEALVVSVVAAVSWSVTSGLSPTLDQLEDYGPLQFFWWISYCRWGAESLYVTVISDWSDYMRVKDNSGYDKDNYGMDLAMMFVLGVLWRIAAYVALRFKNKDKQK
eukprot:CAMPEP_0168554766 /NCGR_PEP_ID=MMETSP0413-20121227/7959_1 /TAXON_ID=136452 /ORGANISM="Filamoeba nolandi, Strain NC-AS-23-1" /LENGTH=782 /DNA_ID=CAMNT_0008585537 /DNA_START=29 /DNA_END=2377 /DNA_ORIENTATION=+